VLQIVHALIRITVRRPRTCWQELNLRSQGQGLKFCP